MYGAVYNLHPREGRRQAVGGKHSFWLSGCKAKSFVFFCLSKYLDHTVKVRNVAGFYPCELELLLVSSLSHRSLQVHYLSAYLRHWKHHLVHPCKVFGILWMKGVCQISSTITNPKAFVGFWGHTFKEPSAQLSVLENGDIRLPYSQKNYVYLIATASVI